MYKEGFIKRWKNHTLVQNTWDGNNIFRPVGMTGSIMVDQKFKDFVDTFKITSCNLIPAVTFSHDFYPQDDISDKE